MAEDSWFNRETRAGLGVALTAGFLLGMPVFAQARDSGRGFLFEPPRAGLTLHGGYALARTGSDIFSYSTSELTLNRRDFNGIDIGADFALSLTPRVDLVLSVSHSGSGGRSEFRHWVDNKDLPIEQNTTFDRVPLTASIDWFLTPRGRSIGQYVWIPARLALFAGGGVGTMWYRFRQVGDFIDYSSADVFHDDFSSSGWALTAHALAGVDYSLSTRWALTGEARYTMANADLSRDFSGFNRIDLGGLSTTVGIKVRF